MKLHVLKVVTLLTLLDIASGASAQSPTVPASASTVAAAPDAGDEGIEEIIVTARRKSETIQDVPQTVNAVTDETISKLNILNFQDIAAVVPGVQLSDGSSGFDSSASMRGVTFNTNSAAPPTVATYFNDAPVNSSFLFQSLFDVGQIEVLRGPQGTLRGQAAPTGSLTVTTRKPDLSDPGGYGSFTYGSHSEFNRQGALNIPIITDKLGLRIAGVLETNDNGDVTSLNDSDKPYARTKGVRGSLEYQPISSINALVTYQHLDNDSKSYVQVMGPGISAKDLKGVGDGENVIGQTFDVVAGQANWTFFNQKLSYVGSFNRVSYADLTTADPENILPTTSLFQHTNTSQLQQTQELRLSSVEPLSIFDYTVGMFYSRSQVATTLLQPAVFYPGAFGSPYGPPDAAAFNSNYEAQVTVHPPGIDREISEFASLTAHLTKKTELTVGARYITSLTETSISGTVASALAALPPQALGAPDCATAGLPSTYPGACDVPLPSQPALNVSDAETHRPVILNGSLSQHFTDDILGYVNAGTSWRHSPGAATAAIVQNGADDPTLNSLIFLRPEKSLGEEVGLKMAFLEHRIEFNAALFHQHYNGLIYQTLPVPYLDKVTATDPGKVTFASFDTNANAVVNGVDLDSSFRLLKHWSLGASFSYADGHVDNDKVPCQDSNFDGVPDSGTPTVAGFNAAGVYVAECKTKGPVSQASLWTATGTSEVWLPLGSHMNTYLRGLYTFHPSNDRESANFKVDDYSILNLYLGVRDPRDAWDVGVYAKNLTDTRTTLSKTVLNTAGSYLPLSGLASGQTQSLPATFGDPGYYGTSLTAPREFGVTMRYAFGSR